MMYLILIILPSLVGFKIISAPYGVLSAASILSPFWYIISDIIAEVYGLKASLRIFWSTVACEIFFAAAGYLLIHLPSPANWHDQSAYNLIIGRIPLIFLCQLFGMAVAWTVNVKLLTYWKVLLRGKYFWLRSLGASGIGETIFTVISISLTLMGYLKIADITSIIIYSFFLKISVLIIFSFPANLITTWLKRKEGIDIYDSTTSFNPFQRAAD